MFIKGLISALDQAQAGFLPEQATQFLDHKVCLKKCLGYACLYTIGNQYFGQYHQEQCHILKNKNTFKKISYLMRNEAQ